MTILIINPGSTSTKIAIWQGDGLIVQETIVHPENQLARLPKIVDQFDLRYKALRSTVKKWLQPGKLDAVVGRGGPLKPLQGGTYTINQKMLDDLQTCRYSNHAANLGAILAFYISNELDIPCFVVDPVTVDEFTDLARISGYPGIERKCRSHALNIKATARQAARELGQPFYESNFIVAHMGGGLSICPLKHGRIVDVNDGLLGMGPFSPERAGALPIGPLVELCYSGRFTREELIRRLSFKSGLKGYLGTSDLIEIEERIDNGDEEAKLYFDAMLYQIAREIGSAAVVLEGKIDGIILTGGMAKSDKLVKTLINYISFLGRIFVMAGEKEMEALARGALRVLEGREEAMEY